MSQGSKVETIKKRASVRTFSPEPLTAEEVAALKRPLGTRVGPLGYPVRLVCFDPGTIEPAALKGMGTYGIIKGASYYVGAVVMPSFRAFVDLGWVFEELILTYTALGLGTCWLGGTYSREAYAGQAGLTGDEVLGAISPVGRAHSKRSLTEKIVRGIAGSRNRKPWGELFFDETWRKPLTRAAAGPYAEPLDCVQCGPSASNRQPWRVVREGSSWHFFLSRTAGYGGGLIRGIDLQAMDLGIAMCHFEAAACELGLPGAWRSCEARGGEKGWEYGVTWVS